MKLVLTERFQSDVKKLSLRERKAILDVILALPHLLGDPHRHSGRGLRKLHPSGVWEAWADLALRLVLTIEPDCVVFVRAGNHDEIRRYLRSL